MNTPPTPPEDHSSPGLHLESGPHSPLDALADMTMAPVAELRHSPWLLRLAMACQLFGTLAVLIVALHLQLGDWGIYLATGLGTNILAGNFMRWRRRSGWVRRFLHTSAAVLVSVAWSILLLDRAISRQVSPDSSASPLFWIPGLLLVGSVPLLIAHMLTSLRLKKAAQIQVTT